MKHVFNIILFLCVPLFLCGCHSRRAAVVAATVETAAALETKQLHAETETKTASAAEVSGTAEEVEFVEVKVERDSVGLPERIEINRTRRSSFRDSVAAEAETVADEKEQATVESVASHKSETRTESKTTERKPRSGWPVQILIIFAVLWVIYRQREK